MLSRLALPVLQPTELVSPERFSYSSLQQLRQCPRRWQLRHARYGEQRGYPEAFNSAAEQGRMVHRLVSLFFRTMASAGNPAPGSPAFQAAARELNPLHRATLLVEEAQRKLTAHPRSRGQRLRFTALDIYNRASVLFQREYQPTSAHQRELRSVPAADAVGHGRVHESVTQLLSRQGSVSERSLAHPTLPLHGIVDLLLAGDHGAIVVDFKTGAPHASHREQVQLYGLLWWRQEGSLPERGEVRYGARVDVVDVDAATLEQLETRLSADLLRLRGELLAEAPATPGEHCVHCPVRPLCDRYWYEPMPGSSWVDAEVLIEGQDALGLRGTLLSSQRVRVLLPLTMDGLRTELSPGTRTRWLGLRRDELTGTLEATAQTEVFVVASPPTATAPSSHQER